MMAHGSSMHGELCEKFIKLIPRFVIVVPAGRYREKREE
jgi:hypothetical protein